MLTNADSITMLYLSKIPTIFQGGFLCAQKAITEDNSTDRVAALGRLTVCYTVGSIIGPALGGVLGSNGDYYLGAKLAVGGSLISIFLCLFMSNKSAKSKISGSATAGSVISKEPGSSVGFASLISVIKAVWVLLGTKTITSVANSMASATLPIILKDTYGLKEQSMGFSMAVMSAFNALVNGVLLSPIVGLFGGRLVALIRTCLLGMCLLYVVQCVLSTAWLSFGEEAIASPSGQSEAGFDVLGDVVTGYYPFFTTTILLGMHQYVLSTVITAMSTQIVEEDHRGTLLGVEHSLFACARIASPQAGIMILNSYGVPGVSGACGSVFLFVYLAWHLNVVQRMLDGGSGMSIEEKKGT